MLHKRLRLIAVPVAAVALPLTVAGFPAHAAGAAPSGKAAAATAPCLADATTLLGDLDGDGHRDKISNPGLTGTTMTIQWGTANGTFGPKQAVSALLGAKKGRSRPPLSPTSSGTANWTWSSTSSRPPTGTTLDGARRGIPPRAAQAVESELPKSRHSDIGDHGEAQQLRIANYGGDAYPDLAIRNNAGDGTLDRDVRLTNPRSGPGNYDYELQVKYGEFGTTSEPPSMPGDGWKHFYKPCS